MIAAVAEALVAAGATYTLPAVSQESGRAAAALGAQAVAEDAPAPGPAIGDTDVMAAAAAATWLDSAQG